MRSSELKLNEFPISYAPYLSTLNNVDLLEELEISLHRFIKFVQDIPMDKFDYQYDLGKWTIKEIIQHLIDSERIFSYRALRIARNDSTELSGFDENLFVVESNAKQRSIMDLLSEFSIVRQSTLFLYKSLKEEELLRIGKAANNEISVRAMGFVIIGHQNHHQSIFSEKYLHI